MPPMLPADAAVNARFSRKTVGTAHPTGAHAAPRNVERPVRFRSTKLTFWSFLGGCTYSVFDLP